MYDSVQIIKDISPTGDYIIPPSRLNVHEFEVFPDRATMLLMFHSRFIDRQHSSIRCWFSKSPNTPGMSEVPINFQNISLNAAPLSLAFYNHSHDFVEKQTDFEIIFNDVVYDNIISSKPKIFFHNAIVSVPIQVGKYYVNVANISNQDNGYGLIVSSKQLFNGALP